MTRKASIKETGEEISQAEWERFDAAVAEDLANRPSSEARDRDMAAADERPAVDPR